MIWNSNMYYQHPTGTVENTPPDKHDLNEVKDNHERNGGSKINKVNRLGYKVANESDPYKYKYYDPNT